MNIRLFSDYNFNSDVKKITDNLNKLSKIIEFTYGGIIQVPGLFINNPITYSKIQDNIKKDSKYEINMIFTDKGYDNNYFWDTDDTKIIIVSFSGWNRLTKVPKNNGVVYFICALILRVFDVGVRHKEINIGCINDFWQDKTGIDAGMKSGVICEDCLRTEIGKGNKHIKVIEEIKNILSDIGKASKSRIDICEFWNPVNKDQLFDVFICYNSKEKESVRDMNGKLKQQKIRLGLMKMRCLQEEYG